MRAPSKWTSEAVVLRYRESSALHSLSPSVSPPTTASADSSMTACAGALSGSTQRSSQVRTHSFTARSPNLRHHPLVMRASRLYARSPWMAPPCIRFLFIDPQLRSTLPPTVGHPSAVALRLAHRDRLAAGLAPARVRPCWAHIKSTPYGVLTRINQYKEPSAR